MYTRLKRFIFLSICFSLTFLAVAVCAGDEDPFIPQVSTKWGPDDEIGNANYMTAEKALDAIGLVRTGKVYDLGMVYYQGMPAYAPRTYQTWHLAHSYPFPKGRNKLTDTEEFTCLSNGIGTQLDGLAHVATNGIFYNHTPGDKVVSGAGTKKFGMEKVPPIVTRGVLIDMVAYKERYLEGGEEITLEDFKGALKKTGYRRTEGRRCPDYTYRLDALGGSR